MIQIHFKGKQIKQHWLLGENHAWGYTGITKGYWWSCHNKLKLTFASLKICQLWQKLWAPNPCTPSTVTGKHTLVTFLWCQNNTQIQSQWKKCLKTICHYILIFSSHLIDAENIPKTKHLNSLLISLMQRAFQNYFPSGTTIVTK